jgi:DNA-binding response OmpR family regulator
VRPSNVGDDLELPRIKRKIFDYVSGHPGASAERLREVVWADDQDGGPETLKAIHVHINQLNRRLAPYRVRIRGSVSGGYRIQFHQSVNEKQR